MGAVLPLSAWAKNEFGESLIIPSEIHKRRLPKGAITAITCGAGNRGNVYGNYSVPLDGGLTALLIAGGAAGYRQYKKKKKA
ncbi:MAG: hypothetical protein RLZZ02_492 [Bacteroidota bacterium]